MSRQVKCEDCGKMWTATQDEKVYFAWKENADGSIDTKEICLPCGRAADAEAKRLRAAE